MKRPQSPWFVFLLSRAYFVPCGLGHGLRCASPLVLVLRSAGACVYARPAGRLALRFCHAFCISSFLTAKDRAKTLLQAVGRPRPPRSSSCSRAPMPGLRARWRARTPLKKLRFSTLFFGGIASAS